MFTYNGEAALRLPLHMSGNQPALSVRVIGNPVLTDVTGYQRSWLEVWGQSGQDYVLRRPIVFWLNPNWPTGSNNTKAFLCLGSGSTPPAKTDYTLESRITSGLEITALSHTLDEFDETNKIEKIGVSFGARNVSENPITIAEIGWFENWYYTNSYLNPIAHMLDRTLLSTPITIPAGDSATIEWHIEFSF